MPESNMSISVNGQSQVPPGFRFHPTEEELLQYYLKKKVSNLRIDLDVIGDVDLNKLEPWDIQEKCRIGTTPQNDWYFFSHKDKKYPTGTRTNRATAAGFWKATGRDKVIHSSCRRIGMRKTLVFYKGRAPHGQKSDWIMHEYRLDDNTPETVNNSSSAAVMIDATQEEGWVVCRIFKKKSHHKTLDDRDRHSPVMSSVSSAAAETRNHGGDNNQLMMMSMFDDSGNEDEGREGALEQIFQCMRRKTTTSTCKEETKYNENDDNTKFLFQSANDINGYMGNGNERFSKLPSLESPNSTGSQNWYQPLMSNNGEMITAVNNNNSSLGFHHHDQMEMITNWAALDRLVASQLNGTTTVDYPSNNNDHDHLPVSSAVDRSSSSSSTMINIKPDNNNYHTAIGQDFGHEVELWSFARSSSSLSSTDPLCHVSDTPL